MEINAGSHNHFQSDRYFRESQHKTTFVTHFISIMVFLFFLLETKSWERSLILTSRNGRDSEKWVLPEQTLNNKRHCVEVRKTEVVFEVDGVATL